ncbi:MAG: metallophosphoesterase, partial [Magnetococcales bacterium]|nr:metallophosphoesterase [Magnetococcales bacterium]
MSEKTIRWLHLSDMHMGCRGEELWWQVRSEFRKSVQSLAKRLGPPHLIFLTGDLTWRGEKAQFEQVTAFLTELKKWLFDAVGGDAPLVVPVPGNHDLERQEATTATLAPLPFMFGTEAWQGYAIPFEESLWQNTPTPFHGLFKNYLEWLRRDILPDRAGFYTESPFPGDFSLRLDRPDLPPLTVVGLNSSWSHFMEGDCRGKLELFRRQLPAALGTEDVDAALEGRNTLLLTHHPLSWFSKETQRHFLESVYRPERFIANLHGHDHTGGSTFVSRYGDAGRFYLMAPSLFGLEKYGTAQESRSMGYQWGCLTPEGAMRLWPMLRVKRGGEHYDFDRDQRYEKHEDNEGLLVRSFGGKTAPQPSVDLDSWLQTQLDKTAWLEIRGIGSGAGRSREAGRYPIEALYTPLRSRGGEVSVANKRGQLPERTEESLSLAHLLASHHRLLIEGQPGAGKTTFLKLAVAMLCRDQLGHSCPEGGSWRGRHLGLSESKPPLLPLFLRLSELADLLAKDSSPKPPDDGHRLLELLAVTTKPEDPEAWNSYWRGRLERGEVLLLLDGLDEVADESLRRRVIAIV